MDAKIYHLIGRLNWSRGEKILQERIALVIERALVLDVPLVLKDKTTAKSFSRDCHKAQLSSLPFPLLPSL